VIYSHEGALLSIEVATAYYADSQAERQWGIARGHIAVPKGAHVMLWSGEDPDKRICERVQNEIDQKCARERYTGIDRVWLCVEQQAGLSGQWDVVRACVKRLRIPPAHQFEKIFLHYQSPLHEDNAFKSIEVWPASSF
jgi:hypothetical protein